MLKQYILVRKDKKFSVGKLMAHAAHVSNIATLKSYKHYTKTYLKWEQEMTKIVLGVKNVAKMEEFHNKCRRLGIPFGIIADNGSYETEPNTVICCAIGPITELEAKSLGLKKLGLFR